MIKFIKTFYQYFTVFEKKNYNFYCLARHRISSVL